MLRLGEDALDWTNLDDLAEIHHGDAIREVTDHVEVVADEEIGQPLLVAQVGEQVEHLALNRDVEC